MFMCFNPSLIELPSFIGSIAMFFSRTHQEGAAVLGNSSVLMSCFSSVVEKFGTFLTQIKSKTITLLLQCNVPIIIGFRIFVIQQ